MTVEGVNDVLALDIDVPNDEPPLVYAEIGVMPGYNDTRIPNIFVEKLLTIFDTTSYSDFVVIVNDGTQDGWNTSLIPRRPPGTRQHYSQRPLLTRSSPIRK